MSIASTTAVEAATAVEATTTVEAAIVTPIVVMVVAVVVVMVIIVAHFDARSSEMGEIEVVACVLVAAVPSLTAFAVWIAIAHKCTTSDHSNHPAYEAHDAEKYDSCIVRRTCQHTSLIHFN